jgi:7,8-dihydropterin-6-yl-methyl-4-(beta-D-ribofuranosyl)aminobenzene 5'-phosphate synthase
VSTNSLDYLKVAEVQGLEVISLMDNSVDFLSTVNREYVQSFRQWTKDRYGEWTSTHLELPIAEHGFSTLIRVLYGGKKVVILFDTGISSDGIIKNAILMGLDLQEIEYIMLSHGHYDHFGGLASILKAINKNDLPLILHEDMFRRRGTANSDGAINSYPNFPISEIVGLAQIIKTRKPQLFADDKILVTGEIPRKTNFEKGFLRHRALIDGKWQIDPLIIDDRAVAFNIKGKGLVIISGCAHAGIINTIKYVQQISGVREVYAVIGGFHLAGRDNEARIGLTVREMRQINPKLIIPMHCTGWRGTMAIAEAFPEAFVWNSVGNLYNFNDKKTRKKL